MCCNRSWLYKVIHGIWRCLPGDDETANQSFRRIIGRFLENRKSTSVTVLQVGAYDGRIGDPLYPYLSRNRNWSGVLLEPHPRAFACLKNSYSRHSKLSLVQAAIAHTDGDVELFCSPDFSLWNWKSQTASLLNEVHERFRPRQKSHFELVRGLTIKTLVKQQNLNHVDIVCVDTEGTDSMVVEQILAADLRPTIISWESWLVPAEEQDQLVKKMLAMGYEIEDSPPDTHAYRIKSD